MSFGAGTSASPSIYFASDTNTGIFSPAADTIAFTEGGVEAMRIDSDGALQIGLTNGNISDGRLIVTATGTGAGTANTRLFMAGYETTSGNNAGLWFGARNNENTGVIGSRTASGNIAFETYSGSWGERARITSGGYFLAGTTSVTDGHSFQALGTTSADYAASFQQNGSGSSARLLRWLTPSSSDAGGYFVYATGNAGANTLNIFSNGNITNTNGSYGTISDIKHKQDIVDARSQWNDIKNIKIRKFRFKNDSTGLLQIGVIAQELEQVSPGLVSEHKDLKEIEVPVLDDNGEPVLNEDGTAQVTKKSVETEETTKSVKTTVLYMKAVKALQEAMARIETLEAQNAAFEARLAALEAK
jgi:hypothetical protein